jgi:hypothetical protein
MQGGHKSLHDVRKAIENRDFLLENLSNKGEVSVVTKPFHPGHQTGNCLRLVSSSHSDRDTEWT